MSFINLLYNLAKSNYLSNSRSSGRIAKNSFEQTNWHKIVSDVYLSKGAIFNIRPEWRNILSLRKFTPISRNNPYGVFDDLIVVVWSSNKGESLNWETFGANTEPSYQYLQGRDKKIRPNRDPVGEDADGDGNLDLGMLPPGSYKYNAKEWWHKDLDWIFRSVGKNSDGAKVYRDINRDGYFTEDDEKLVKNPKLMYERNTMYIHKGGIKNTSSAGCQTMHPKDFERFRANMKEANLNHQQLEFTYLLIDIT